MRDRFRRLPARLAAAFGVAAVVGSLVGCGGGGSSYNVDDGFYTDGRGNKTITRTLDNRTRFWIDVRLEINGDDYLDTLRIPPDDYVNVTIERMRVEDYIWYSARFDGGDTTTGTFAEDGATIFEHSDSRAVGLKSTNVDGKAVVKAGGKAKRFSRSGSSH